MGAPSPKTLANDIAAATHAARGRHRRATVAFKTYAIIVLKLALLILSIPTTTMRFSGTP